VIKDRNGNQLRIGDEVVIRGRIVKVIVEQPEVALLEVEWKELVPVIDFVKSTSVERAADVAEERGSDH
jgi:hypothetical protein